MSTDVPVPPIGPTPVRTSRNLNLAWLAFGSLAAVFGLLFGTVQTIGIIAHEERTEQFAVSDPAVRVLDVGSDAGSIEIVGGDVSEVTITARVSDGLVATQFTHQVVGDRLQVRVRCKAIVTGPWCRAGLRIMVPRDLEVKVRSNHDSVSVRGVTGRVDAESADGSVEAEALAGDVRLHSGNGSVRATRLRSDSVQADSDNGSVRLEFERAARSVIARSDNGSVEVAVPRTGTGYAVVINSNEGSADNLVRTDSESGRRIVASSGNGSVTVRYLD